MPSYDYFCPTNQQRLEVKHSMSQSVKSWGELCALAGLELGDTPAEAPVQQKIGASAVHTVQIGEWKKTTPKKPSPGHRHGPGCGC